MMGEFLYVLVNFLPLLGLLIFISPAFLPFSINAAVFPPLAAYIFGLGATVATEFGFRRFRQVLFATATVFSFIALPPWLGPFLWLFAGAAVFYFGSIYPALLYGRERLPFAVFITILSVIVALPSAFTPIPFGTVYPPDFMQHVLRQDPLYTRLNWVRYLIDIIAYRIALRLTIRVIRRLENGHARQ